MKIHIQNGRLIDPANNIDTRADLYVAAGKVAAVGRAPGGFSANRVIDASGLVVCPGLIDLSARLREPGFEYKATLESEMLAAVAGGVTSLACPPDTEPPLDEPGLVEMLKHRAKTLNLAHVYPIGALTVGLAGEQLTEMAELRDAGCVGFSHADVPLQDNQVLWRALQYAATFGFCVWLRPQDGYLAKGGVAHDGEVATRLGLPGIPAFAETIAVATIIELMRATGTRVHLCRVSTREGVAMVRAATRDLNALREGLNDGTIDALCSDHTPVDEDSKLLPFGESEAGATGLELLLPLTLKWALELKVPLAQALARITQAPARILDLDAGHLSEGHTADVCIFDAEHYGKVSAAALKSQGKNTPFLGIELPGKVRYTLVQGLIAYDAGTG